jgi:hypothetical protein
MLTYSLDNGKTWISCDTIVVKKEYPLHINDENEEVNAELVTKFEQAGLTTNVWVHNTCEGTSSESYLEIGNRLVDGV